MNEESRAAFDNGITNLQLLADDRVKRLGGLDGGGRGVGRRLFVLLLGRAAFKGLHLVLQDLKRKRLISGRMLMALYTLS